MAITETKKIQRPSTSVPFFSELNDELHTRVADNMKPLLDSGKVTKNVTVSPDGLTETFVNIYDGLDTFAQAENIRGSDLDLAFMNYTSTHNFADLGADTYKLEGIDSPFSHTIVYHFTDSSLGATVSDQILIRCVANNKLHSLDVGTDNVTAVFHYNNAADFTEHHYNDLGMLQSYGENLTRTLSYSLI